MNKLERLIRQIIKEERILAEISEKNEIIGKTSSGKPIYWTLNLDFEPTVDMIKSGFKYITEYRFDNLYKNYSSSDFKDIFDFFANYSKKFKNMATKGNNKDFRDTLSKAEETAVKKFEYCQENQKLARKFYKKNNS